jgi:hypothetical protein
MGENTNNINLTDNSVKTNQENLILDSQKYNEIQ